MVTETTRSPCLNISLSYCKRQDTTVLEPQVRILTAMGSLRVALSAQSNQNEAIPRHCSLIDYAWTTPSNRPLKQNSLKGVRVRKACKACTSTTLLRVRFRGQGMRVQLKRTLEVILLVESILLSPARAITSTAVTSTSATG